MLTLWIAGPTSASSGELWIARGLHRSISQISISLKDAAGGLEHEVGRVELHPSDDLPALQQQVQLVSARIKQVVEELQQARRETMLADRLAAVGELAAGVAHELRNPLTSVKLLIQTAARRSCRPSPERAAIHVVLEQIVRMENTIQGLLDFARPPEMQQVRHDLRDTLRRALNLVEGHAKQQEVVVREDCPSAPVLVDGDPDNCTRCSSICCSTASKPCPKAANCRSRSSGDDVTDACLPGHGLPTPGQGFPKPSWSGCSSLRHQQGTRHGLGTGHQPPHRRAARRQAHGGESRSRRRRVHRGVAARASERPAGRGRRWRSRLRPISKPFRLEFLRPARRPPMPRLLIIDDEPSIRLSIEAVFDRADVAVFGAETAEEGLRLGRRTVAGRDPAGHPARRAVPGWTCSTNCGESTRRSLVIFITGHGTTETAIEAMKLGAYDYLTKPLDAKQLQAGRRPGASPSAG